MAIIENIASEIGDVIRIKTEVPVVGLLFLDTFTDSTEGESPTAYFNKEFRYSNDAGLNFTPWQQLNLLNIQNVVVEKKDQFILEYRYEVVGSETDPELRFNSITVSGDFENLDYPIYDSTVFDQFFDVNDINVLNWAINVLEKLYRGGILPEYVKRGYSNDDNTADKDFISYWNTVTHFFALIVYFFRQFENITGQKQLLKSFLNNKDLSLPTDDNLSELSYILYNYIDEYRKRGTERIVFKEGENGEGIDGEFLRLINWREHDEMLFALANNSETGWCLGESSPMWSGTENVKNLTKAFEYSEGVEDLSKYPLVGNTFLVNIHYDTIIGKNVLKIRAEGNVGISNIDPVSTDDLIKVGEGLDYEISFFIKKDADVNEDMTFRCIGYDEYLNVLNTYTLDNQYINSFIIGGRDNILRVPNTYYFIRGVVFNFDKENEDLSLNFKNGVPLKFQPSTKYMGIQIYFPSNIGASVYIYDLKVKPLNLPMTQGLLGVKNIIFSYINNRGSYNNNILESFVQNRLIPYNSWFKPYYWEDSGLLPSLRSKLTIIVTDTQGVVIEGAKVSLSQNELDLFTDALGKVEFFVFDKTWNIYVEKDGYWDKVDQVTVSGVDIKKTVVILEKGTGFGYLYNFYVVDIAENDGRKLINNYSVPTYLEYEELSNYLGSGSGGKLKEVGYLRWRSPNEGAIDLYNYSAIGGGRRDVGASSVNYFENIYYNGYYWGKGPLELGKYGPGLRFDYVNDRISFSERGLATTGKSLRLSRLATTQELNDYSDGDVVETVLDYDGNSYDCVIIGNRLWTRQNLKTTTYMDGTSIQNIIQRSDWADCLNTRIGAYCAYNNDENNV